LRPTVIQVLIDPFLAATAQQCCPRRAGLPARSGSSLQRNDAGVWLCEYPGRLFSALRYALVRFSHRCSSAGYDEPAILSYAITSFCPTSADGLQPYPFTPSPTFAHSSEPPMPQLLSLSLSKVLISAAAILTASVAFARRAGS